MRDPKRLVRLGVFGAAQGVRGEVRVKSFTADPRSIGAYGPLTDASGGRAFRFEAIRPLKNDMIVARVAGVATRDAAQALTGTGLFARRDQLPEPAEGEYYHEDLLGLSAATPEGEPIGEVVAVLNFGAADILEIRPDAGGETILLPFADAFAPQVDFAAGRIIVVLPSDIEDDGAR